MHGFEFSQTSITIKSQKISLPLLQVKLKNISKNQECSKLLGGEHLLQGGNFLPPPMTTHAFHSLLLLLINVRPIHCVQLLNCHIRVVDFVKSPKLHGFSEFSHSFWPKEFTKWKKLKIFSCLLSPQAGFSFILWTTKGGKIPQNGPLGPIEGVGPQTSNYF